VLHSLQLVDGADPPKVLYLDRAYRPVYFSPKRLIARAEDFVPDFEESVKKIPKEFITLITDITDYITGSGKDKPESKPESKSVISVISVMNQENNKDQGVDKGSDQADALPKEQSQHEPQTKSVTSITSVTKPGVDQEQEQSKQEDPDPSVTEPIRPQRCPYPEVCKYYGVFLYPKDLDEHLQKLHGGVKE
jgi:hypothetical protein